MLCLLLLNCILQIKLYVDPEILTEEERLEDCVGQRPAGCDDVVEREVIVGTPQAQDGEDAELTDGTRE